MYLPVMKYLQWKNLPVYRRKSQNFKGLDGTIFGYLEPYYENENRTNMQVCSFTSSTEIQEVWHTFFMYSLNSYFSNCQHPFSIKF